MTPLEVQHLEKHYPAFSLENVSFSLRPGKITGFIGRNGAGKTTTLKAILGLLHRDGGEILFWGQPFGGHEREIKQRIGYVSGGVRFYPGKHLSSITAVTRRFYENWDEDAYARCLRQFSLDETKTPAELSEGMKVKYALTLALSHRAELLILDEPTSGLDPVSRDALLEIFLRLQNEGVTVLFSTHITSDLSHCADDLIYIRQGRILAQGALPDFTSGYRLLRLDDAPPRDTTHLPGLRREKSGYTALVQTRDAASCSLPAEPADLETIMIHLEREAEI